MTMIDNKTLIIASENLCANLAIIGDGYTIRDCQLSQRKAHTAICAGVKDLTFEGCNLKNCVLPQDAVIVDCLVCHEDIVELTEQQLADSAKKMELEQQVLDLLRTTVKAEIVKADLTKATAESVKASVITASTVAGK